MLPRKIHHLRHFGLGDLVSEDAALTDPMLVNVQHDLGRGFHVLLEKSFDDMNDEFHRRVVVVQDQHPIQARPLGLRLHLGDDGGSRTARRTGTALVIAHLRRFHRGDRGFCGDRQIP